jgi:hypothetical protein
MAKAVRYVSIDKKEDVRRFAKAVKSFTAANTKSPEMATKVLSAIGAADSEGNLKKNFK